MKSSHKNSPLSGVFSVFAVGLVAVVGFFTLGSVLPRQQSQEQVLGTSTHTTTVTKNVDGARYQCQRTDCGKVSHNTALVDDNNPNAPSECRAIKDSMGNSVCHWNNPILTLAQCDGDKKIYRNGTYKNNLSTPGGLNQAFTEDAENIVYYNCLIQLTPTPTPVKTCTVVGNKCCSLYLGGGKGTRYYCNNNLQCSDQWGGATCQRRDPTPAPTRKPTPKPSCVRGGGERCGYLSNLCEPKLVTCQTGMKCLTTSVAGVYRCGGPGAGSVPQGNFPTDPKPTPTKKLTPTPTRKLTPTPTRKLTPSPTPTRKPTPTKAAPRNVI